MKEDTILENNTQMNESTILDTNERVEVANDFDEEVTAAPANKEEKSSKTWVGVTLGGVSAILMGAAGVLYSQKMHGETPPPPPYPEPTPQPEPTVPVAEVDSRLPFGEAFELARTELGPGGVFCWKGGVYNTFTAEEWAAMTPAERSDFAHNVPVVVPATHLDPPTDTNTTIVINVNPEHHGNSGENVHPTGNDTGEHPEGEGEDNGDKETAGTGGDGHEGQGPDDVVVVDEQTKKNFDIFDDVRLVNFSKDDNDHLIAGYDSNDDGKVDIAIVDIDNDNAPSNPDIVVDDEGNVTTFAEIVGGNEGIDENPYTGYGQGEEDPYYEGEDSEETADDYDTPTDDGYYYTSGEDDSFDDVSDNDLVEL